MEVVELKNFFENKRVLITGHTGFKGSYLSIWLDKLGAKVIGYSVDIPTKESIFLLSGIGNKIEDIRGDILDEEHLLDIFTKYQPELVFHMAAQPLVNLSYDKPKYTYEVNVIGTLNVLNCIKKTESVKSAVIITTDKCYDNKEQIWAYREGDALGGHDMYSSSKACAEILTDSFCKSFNLDNVATGRAGNVIGGGDFAQDRIIPDFIRAIKSGKPLDIRNPNAIRPWQHVLEPLYGYITLSMLLYSDSFYKGSWNFGTTDTRNHTVLEVCNLLKEIFPEISYNDVSNKAKNHEANILKLDSTKASVYLGYNSILTFEETIKWTATWYKEFLNTSVYDLTCRQIDDYMEMRTII